MPFSYHRTWLLWGHDSGYGAWKTLLETDPNPFLLRCYFHDDPMRQRMLQDPGQDGSLKNARSLALRRDGSVGMPRRQDRANLLIDANGHARQDFKRDYWTNASELPCPPTVCDGKYPPDFSLPPGFRG